MSKSVKVAVGVIAIALAYSGASWYMGKKLESEISQHIQTFNDYAKTQLNVASNGSEFQLNLTHYDRGIFNSRVHYELLIGEQEDPVQLLLNDQLQHGPFPIKALFNGHVAPALAFSHVELEKNAPVQRWFEATKGVNPLQAKSVISLDGSVNSVIDIAETAIEEDGTLFHSAKSTVDVHYKAKAQELKISGLLPSLRLEEPHDGSLLTLGPLHFNGNVKGFEPLKGTQHSAGVMQLDSVFFSSPSTGESEIRNISIESMSEIVNGFLAGSANYSIEAILINAKDIGKIDLHVDVKRLNYDVLNQIAQKSSEDAPEQELTPLLQELVKYRPELAITNFSWKNNGGISSLSTAVEIAPTAFNEREDSQPELEHFVNRLHVDILLSRAMLTQALGGDSMVGAFADMAFDRIATEVKEAGLITYNGIDAATRFQFDAKTNQLVINDKAVTPEELFAMFMALQMLSSSLF